MSSSDSVGDGRGMGPGRDDVPVSEDADLQRLGHLIGIGVPADALAFYGRWYQLETWLRERDHLRGAAGQVRHRLDCPSDR